MTAPGRARQDRIYRDGVSGARPRVPTGPDELERRARRAMSRRADAYVTGGAGAETTMRAEPGGVRPSGDRAAGAARRRRAQPDRRAVGRIRRTLPAPLLLAPIGALDLVRRGADLAVARGAAAAGIPMVISNQAGAPMEEIAAVGGPTWFQLYWSTSDELVDSFLRRAESAGCDAVVVTLDTTMLGWRPRDLDLGHLPFARGIGIAQYTSDPVFRRLVEETLAAPSAGAPPKVTPQAVRTLLEITRNAPGRFRDNLRSPVRGRPWRPSCGSTRDRGCPGRTWQPCARGPGCRSCSRGSCTPTTPAAPPTPVWTGSSCPTTAAARSTTRSPRWTRCPVSSTRSAMRCRCCSTPGCGPGPRRDRGPARRPRRAAGAPVRARARPGRRPRRRAGAAERRRRARPGLRAGGGDQPGRDRAARASLTGHPAVRSGAPGRPRRGTVGP